MVKRTPESDEKTIGLGGGVIVMERRDRTMAGAGVCDNTRASGRDSGRLRT